MELSLSHNCKQKLLSEHKFGKAVEILKNDLVKFIYPIDDNMIKKLLVGTVIIPNNFKIKTPKEIFFVDGNSLIELDDNYSLMVRK